jgi:putative redox protein
MTKELNVTAKLTDGMHFAVETGSGYGVDLDMAVGSGGEGLGSQPMEMLLVGLAGCAGMSNLLILRKRRQDVRNYEIHIHGIRTETFPQVFTEIYVEHVITGKDLSEKVVERAMSMTEQKYCSANVMLEKTANIRHIYKIITVI